MFEHCDVVEMYKAQISSVLLHTRQTSGSVTKTAANGQQQQQQQHAVSPLPPIEVYSLGSSHQPICYSWETFSPLSKQTRVESGRCVPLWPTARSKLFYVRQRRVNLINHVDWLC